MSRRRIARNNFIALITIASCAASRVAYATGDVAAGKARATTCTACHGEAGNSNNEAMFPTLAGKDAKFLYEQLKAFKDGTRKTPNAALMRPNTLTMTDQDMQNLAAYFASQKPKKAAGK